MTNHNFSDENYFELDLSCKPSISRRSRRRQNEQIRKNKRSHRRRAREQVVVYVGNLPTGCTGRQLLQHFSSYTSYIRHKVKIFETQDSNRTTYSLLYFDSFSIAYGAIWKMNDSIFLGNVLLVEEYDRNSLQGGKRTGKRTTLKSLLKECETVQIACGFGVRMDSKDDVSTNHSMNNSYAKQTFSVGVGNLRLHCTFQKLLNQSVKEYFLSVTEEHVGGVSHCVSQAAYLKVGKNLQRAMGPFTEIEVKNHKGLKVIRSSVSVRRLPSYQHMSQEPLFLDYFHYDYRFKRFQIRVFDPHSVFHLKNNLKNAGHSTTEDDSTATDNSSCISVSQKKCASTQKMKKMEKERNNAAHQNQQQLNILDSTEQAVISIHHLPLECSPEQLLELFSDFKLDIVNKRIRIITPKSINSTPPSYSYTFLCFSSLEKAEEAVMKMNKKRFCGNKISVKLLHTKPNKKPDGTLRTNDSEKCNQDRAQSKTTKSANSSISCDKLLPRDATTSYESIDNPTSTDNSYHVNTPTSAHVFQSSITPGRMINHTLPAVDGLPSVQPSSVYDSPSSSSYEDHLHHRNDNHDQTNVVHIKHSIGDCPLEPPYIQPPSYYKNSSPSVQQITNDPDESRSTLPSSYTYSDEDCNNIDVQASNTKVPNNDQTVVHSEPIKPQEVTNSRSEINTNEPDTVHVRPQEWVNNVSPQLMVNGNVIMEPIEYDSIQQNTNGKDSITDSASSVNVKVVNVNEECEEERKPSDRQEINEQVFQEPLTVQPVRPQIKLVPDQSSPCESLHIDHEYKPQSLSPTLIHGGDPIPQVVSPTTNSQLLLNPSLSDNNQLPHGLSKNTKQVCISDEKNSYNGEPKKKEVPQVTTDDLVFLSYPQQSPDHDYHQSVDVVNPIPQLSPTDSLPSTSSSLLQPFPSSDSENSLQDLEPPKSLPLLQSYISSVITESKYDQIMDNVRKLGINYEEEIAKLNMEKDSEMKIRKEKLQSCNQAMDDKSSSSSSNKSQKIKINKQNAENTRQKSQSNFVCVGIYNLPPGYTSQQILDHLSADLKSTIMNKRLYVKPNIKKSVGHAVSSSASICFDSIENARKVVNHIKKKIKIKDGRRIITRFKEQY